MELVSLIHASVFVTYFAPILLFVGIAAIIGFTLSFLSEKLNVERDPRIVDVAHLLAGVNCGGCGYAGCDAFAEALVKGETTIDKCKPTRSANKKEIAKILGTAEDNSAQMVAVVHCNGGNKCRNKYSYQGYGDCMSAETIAGGNKACRTGCIGYGDCNASCAYDAIGVNSDTGVAEVNSKNCTACGACVDACPKRLISRIPTTAKVYVACTNPAKGKEVRDICENGCIACGLCERKCPHEAIVVYHGLAKIDYDKCTGCGVCKDVCPTKCIHGYEHGVNGTDDAPKHENAKKEVPPQVGQGA